MRRLILLGLAVAMVLPSSAARRVTVARLEQTLAAATAEHRTDAETARQIDNLELTERLTDAVLNRLAAKLLSQPRTSLAVQLLADQSAFLDPPPAELPATGAPDPVAQQRMLDAARGNVLQTLPHLPNFFATRTTRHFDDGPQVLVKGDWPVRDGLHLAATSSRQITFRDGKEVEDPTAQTATAPAAKASQETGLHTWGEFGPELAIVLVDLSKGSASWSHWERTSNGLAAVFHYTVPRTASHYQVDYCCVLNAGLIDHRAQAYAGGSRSLLNAGTFTETPGYHGSLSIDPVTGSVLRITLEADLKPAGPLLRAATVVEYGTVTIGDRSYVCPVRSLALSMEAGYKDAAAELSSVGATWGNPMGRSAPTPTLLVNETTFTSYHRLGTTMRVITDTASVDPAASGGTASSRAASTQDSVPPAAESSAPSPPPANAQLAATSPPIEPAAETVAPSSPPPSAPAVPEITVTASTGVPDLPANAGPPQDSGFSLKLTSRLVDVGIVAYDKKGRPLTDLKAENFEVYDNGRKQEIRFFTPAAGSMAPSSSPPAATEAPNRRFTNRVDDPAAVGGAAPAPQPDATILLIDESHIGWNDLTNARRQMLEFLGTLAPTEHVGLYTMSSLGFRVLVEITTDHAALIARLKTFLPSAQSVAQAQDEETRNRQLIDEVHHASDLDSVNGNQSQALSNGFVDPQLLTMGSNPARASLIILAGVARHLSSIPGHKNLVWVSTDNVFADWQDQAVGIDKSPRPIDTFALHAQEAMNDAHTAVYPFDVSQLETAAITADIQHRNVELTPAAKDIASLGGGLPNDNSPGRIKAQMRQDLHAIQAPIVQVAEATGGRTIRRSGDLAAALASIVADGLATYQLSFTPESEADNSYHLLTVKLSGRRGLTLRYRTGYYFDKEPVTLKDRFQQAVWRPMDVSEIAVTADIASLGTGAAVKINIAAADLGLRQQADRWMDKLDIFFIQRDDAGIHATLDGQTLGLRLKSATYQSLLPQGLPFEHEVVLRPGMASLRVLVVDENSGRMGSVTIPAPDLGPAH